MLLRFGFVAFGNDVVPFVDWSAVFNGFDSCVDEDFCVFPMYCCDVADGYQDIFATDPMVRVDDEVGNLPGLIVDDEVVDVADVAVDGVEVVSGDFVTASQVGVFGGFLCCFRRPYQVGVDDRRRWNNAPDVAWNERCVPIGLPGIIVDKLFFVLTRDGLVGIDGRAVAYLFAGEVYGEYPGFPGMFQEGVGGDQHFAPRQPGAGFYDQVSDGPGLVIKVEIFHFPNFSVGGVQVVAN